MTADNFLDLGRHIMMPRHAKAKFKHTLSQNQEPFWKCVSKTGGQGRGRSRGPTFFLKYAVLGLGLTLNLTPNLTLILTLTLKQHSLKKYIVPNHGSDPDPAPAFYWHPFRNENLYEN